MTGAVERDPDRRGFMNLRRNGGVVTRYHRHTKTCRVTISTRFGRYLRSSVLGIFAFVLTLGSGVGGYAEAAQPAKATPHRIRTAEAPQHGFKIEERRGVWWLVRPAGTSFFSLGVNCVNEGQPRDSYRSENAEYAAWQHYRDSGEWAKITLSRLQSWGFTTIGGWSTLEALRPAADPNTYFIPVLNLGAGAGAPWRDMWDPKIIEKMDQLARDQILPLRVDPRVIGYYTDNELGWWSGAMFELALEQPASSGQRRRLLTLLQRHYHGNWSALTTDFDPEGVTNWAQLRRGGKLYLRANGHGVVVLRKFLGLVADRYYFLVRQIIHKYDRRALVLGDRYQSFYYPEVARAAGKYLDAISTNLNAPWNDGTFPRFFLPTLHGLGGKPITISEFYLSAVQNRSGNQNSKGVYPVVETQEERAVSAKKTLELLAQTPYVIGADWFQYYDEPTRGRGDGEDYNFGLVDIDDRPYDSLNAAMSGVQTATLKRDSLSQERVDASKGVPRAPEDPLAHFTANWALKDWDRNRGFVVSSSPSPMADLYLCWAEDALYVGLYAQDINEDTPYRDKVIPQEHRAQWRLTVGGHGTRILARMGAGLEASVDRGSVEIVNHSGVRLNVRNIAAMKIPAREFGKERFVRGDSVDLTSIFITGDRADRTEWRGHFVLAD